MKRLALAILMTAGCFYGLHGALTRNFYTSSSILNSGTWIKIGVEKTGVYEISYEILREMGFSDPSKVAVYGRGGRVLSESFVTPAGIPVLTDDITPVKILHEDGKVYFYGLGPEEINFNVSPDYAAGGYFNRTGNNIYTRRGYYFLTDTREVSRMDEMSHNIASAKKIENGVSFVYHELDSIQNSTQSGQLFWGEKIGLPGLTKRKWNIQMPDAIPGPGVMECVNYFAPGYYGENPRVEFGFEGKNLKISSNPYQENTSLYYAPHNPSIEEIDIPGSEGMVFVAMENVVEMRAYANLDYWVVSYQSAVPTLNTTNQQLFAIPSLEKNSTGKLELSNPASLVVLDVTSATNPQRLKITQSGPVGTVGIRGTNKTPVIVVFDKGKPQLQISGYEKNYEKIENQNLHGYKEEGADFIIITTPRFKPYAEEIADLHRLHDGIKVIVATTEQLYNEFSGGTPDPMAYRSFAKMLYFSDCKPKNILLLGPLYGDFRGLQQEHDPSDGIIAYQSPAVSINRGAHNINDFYGMMSDKFRTDYYERNDVNIGIGILPVKFESDARMTVDKIKDYLEREDFAYHLNRYTAVGGLGDEHTHDIQVRDLNNHIRVLDNVGTIFTPIAIDTYGNAEARKKFLSQLNEGATFFSYFGHGAEQFLGKDRYFFNAGDVYSLRNKMHPFALFGGCQITNPDRGLRGLGETIVTSTPYGCIGSIVSARDTWSGQNFEFFKQFFICLYTQGSTVFSAKRVNPVTIGEVYASVKNYSTYSNELSYQLICDPALVVPAINRSVNIEPSGNSNILVPGNTFSFKGSVFKADGTVDSDFNGEVVVRLNEPERQVEAGMIETKEDPKSLVYTYRDEQVSMIAGEVKDGKFSLKMHVPSSLSNFNGKKALIYISAYDPVSKVGAGKGFEVEIGVSPQVTDESTDILPPVVDKLRFSTQECSIEVSVSDNLALNMSTNPLNKGLYLYIDGQERSEAHFVEPIMESGRAAYSKKIYIDGLSQGEHSARIKVKDAAGNSSEREITFVYQPRLAKYIISRDVDNSSASSTVIKIDSAIAPPSSVIVILSPDGNEVWRGQPEGNSIEWGHEDFRGEKVPAGHYKAYLIETGSVSYRGHSESIDVPVV